MSITSVSYNQDGSFQMTQDDIIYAVPNDPGNRHYQEIQDWISLGNVVTPYQNPPISSKDINAERERRIELGSTFNITGAGEIPVTGTIEDSRNIQSLQSVAALRIGSGDTTTITVFRDALNNNHDLTPPQIIELYTSTVTYVSLLYSKSWELKALDPIPSDYTDDKYWTN